MKNTLLAIISLICFYTNAQDNSFDKDVKDLVELTLNLDRLNGMRSILFSELLDSEKQGFTQSYDSIVIAYNTEFEAYYKEQYTPAEVRQLLDFHNGTVGQRLAADIGRLYQNDLPEIFTLNQRLSELHKTFRKEKQSGAYSANAISPNYSHDTEIARLLEDIGAKEFLDAVKTREIMHVEPKYEADLIKAFDKVATQYIVDLKQYFS